MVKNQEKTSFVGIYYYQGYIEAVITISDHIVQCLYKKWALFFLKRPWGTNWTLSFLHRTPISGSYSSDLAYPLHCTLAL